tara:strand:+ start:480 stop:671 length:192 start_codon:yes stop_codon:yes gene_type:complete
LLLVVVVLVPIREAVLVVDLMVKSVNSLIKEVVAEVPKLREVSLVIPMQSLVTLLRVAEVEHF